MGDGIVTVNAQGDQDVRASVCDACLQEFDHFAGQIAGTPFDGDAPHDIRQHAQQTHAQICQDVVPNGCGKREQEGEKTGTKLLHLVCKECLHLLIVYLLLLRYGPSVTSSLSW